MPYGSDQASCILEVSRHSLLAKCSSQTQISLDAELEKKKKTKKNQL